MAFASGPVCSEIVALAAEDWADWAAGQASELAAEEIAWPWMQWQQRLERLAVH